MLVKLLCGPTFLVAAAVAAQAAPKQHASKDVRVWAAAEQARPAQLKLLGQVVNIDSGTGDIEGGRAVAALLRQRLEAAGMTVRSVAAEAPGLPENIVATITGTGKGRILLIGHLDTGCCQSNRNSSPLGEVVALGARLRP